MSSTHDNIRAYAGAEAATAWAADPGFYPTERALVERWFPAPPARVADLGCGAGRTTASLVELGYDVTALDLAPDLLAVAEARVPQATFLLRDAAEVDALGDPFDAVLFSFNGIDCIRPVGQRVALLAAAYRALRPGGILYLSTHDAPAQVRRDLADRDAVRRVPRWLAAQVRRPSFLQGYWRMGNPTHQVLYARSPGVTVRQLRSAGFTVLAVAGARKYKQEGTVDLPVAGRGASARSGLQAFVGGLAHVHLVAQRPAR